MKKSFLHRGSLVLFSLFFSTMIMAQPVAKKLNLKGTLSPNTENSKNDPDPAFTAAVTSSIFQSQFSKAGNSKNLSELENGLQIVKDIIQKMVEREYRFSLLSGHKYMINSCLGIKVSVGEFSLRFSEPVVELGETGKIKIKLGVSRINLSVLKVRMRPRSPDFEDPNPCHFSGKFEIGGEVTDLTMRAEINPLAQALSGGTSYCFLAFADQPDVEWKIGGLNLKPLQNNLDAMGKDMIEDALNNGMSDLFYTKFIEISRMIIPKYFSGCEKVYANNKELVEQLQGVVNNANTNPGNGSINEGNGSVTESAKWVIAPVTMKGVLGKLNTKFPDDVDWSIDLRTATDNKFITNRSGYSKHGPQQDVAPGNYNFQLNSVLVENVPIEKGKETRLKTGILHIVSEGTWELRGENKEVLHTTGNKPKKFALPVGNYQLKLGGQLFPLTIKDGEMVEM